MNNIFKNKGFSLVEVTVVIAIMTIIFILGGNFIITGFRSTTFGSEQTDAVDNGRKALESLTLDVREAIMSERGDYALNTIEDQNFVWFGDIDNDGAVEMIRYFLENTSLKRIVTEPGDSNNYDGSVSTSTIASHINNQAEPIFYYYDSNNATTSVINNVRLVNIVLKMNVTPEIAPNDYYIETDVHLRNLKDNL